MQRYLELPALTFDGGETQKFEVQFLRHRRPIYLARASATFALLDYVNPGEPYIKKECSISDDAAYVEFQIDPQETASLGGKYIYRLTVRDLDGNVEVFRGFFIIARNDSPDYINKEERK